MKENIKNKKILKKEGFFKSYVVYSKVICLHNLEYNESLDKNFIFYKL